MTEHAMVDHSNLHEAPPPYSENRNPQLDTPSPSLAARTPPELSPSPEPLPDRKSPLSDSAANQGPAQPGPIGADDNENERGSDKPPENAQRARAPLLITRANQSISGDWLLFTDDHVESEKKADARFETTNSSLKATLWIANSDWKAPVTVQFKTTNSSIGVAVHTQVKGQAVHISSRTSNSRNQVLLPPDFHGVIKMSTSNNKCLLSDSLRRRSVRIPKGPEEKTWDAEWYEIGGPGGPSIAELRTSNSRVSVGLIGDKDEAEVVGNSIGKGSCSIM